MKPWTRFLLTRLLALIVVQLGVYSLAQSDEPTPESVRAASKFGWPEGRENDFASVTLSAKSTSLSLSRNEATELTVRFRAKQRVMVVNPWCEPLLNAPFRVAVFTAGKAYLGVGNGHFGSQRSETITDVVTIPTNGLIEAKIKFGVGSVRWLTTSEAVVGKFYLQLIYDRDFSKMMAGLQAFPPYFSEDELFKMVTAYKPDTLRSNLIEIEIVE